MKVAELQSALTQAHPLIPSLLQTIHRQLKADPDNVTLLNEDDIATIVRGLQHQTKVTLTESATKSAAKRSLKSITVDDL